MIFKIVCILIEYHNLRHFRAIFKHYARVTTVTKRFIISSLIFICRLEQMHCEILMTFTPNEKRGKLLSQICYWFLGFESSYIEVVQKTERALLGPLHGTFKVG